MYVWWVGLACNTVAVVMAEDSESWSIMGLRHETSQASA